LSGSDTCFPTKGTLTVYIGIGTLIILIIILILIFR
jgi:hypothetical protein